MAKRRNEDKIVRISKETTTTENGEIKSEKSSQTVLLAQEPNYIKLYINTLLAFKDLPKQMNPLLFELLKHMTFADPTSEHGGQLIIMNTFVKEGIIKRLDIKMNTLDQGLTKLVKSGIIKRVGYGTYQANPNMFGRGEWMDIKSIRATFDFNAQTVSAHLEMRTEEENEKDNN